MSLAAFVERSFGPRASGGIAHVETDQVDNAEHDHAGAKTGEMVSDAAQPEAKRADIALVIIPFLSGRIAGLHAASFSFMAGVMPPMPMFGR